jgi:pimeloyl-ACP methyl ester carboxylesterase
MNATSKDGTVIAYEKTGEGPALILVDGALCSRAFGPMGKLAVQFESRFTVVRYDRRGRGESGDTAPYSKQREIEDLAAVIQATGGPAFVLGLSSGAALALEAAAAGVPLKKIAAYEPPYVGSAGADFEGELKKRLAAGDRGGALKYFMVDMVGAPGFMVVVMKLMFWTWRKLKAVAHTLPYDAAVMSGFEVPTARLASIKIPTLALAGSKTTDRLKKAARAVGDAVPGARHRELAGQTHMVNPAVLAPVVTEFFTGD